jgi:hypothetical protein
MNTILKPLFQIVHFVNRWFPVSEPAKETTIAAAPCTYYTHSTADSTMQLWVAKTDLPNRDAGRLK